MSRTMENQPGIKLLDLYVFRLWHVSYPTELYNMETAYRIDIC